MKKIQHIMLGLSLLLAFTSCATPIKNAKTETVKVYGNCGMCKKTIENAGNQKDISSVIWSEDTKMATITYNSKVTTPDEILERIAKSGYDSEKHRATNQVYEALPGCCQYDRPD